MNHQLEKLATGEGGEAVALIGGVPASDGDDRRAEALGKGGRYGGNGGGRPEMAGGWVESGEVDREW